MQVEVNGTRLWFDVDGSALVPAGPSMQPRPTVILVHGGPGGWDHSYFKPDFAPLVEHAQVIYLDLRGHGRSETGDPSAWSFEACADDLRAVLRRRRHRQTDRPRALHGRTDRPALRRTAPRTRGRPGGGVGIRALRRAAAGRGFPTRGRRRGGRFRRARLPRRADHRRRGGPDFGRLRPTRP